MNTTELIAVAQKERNSGVVENDDLGSMAYRDSGDFATAAQGLLADSAIQPGDNISLLNNDNGYVFQADIDQAIADLNLGTASQSNVEDFATAAQGLLADSALQPGDNISELTNDSDYQTGTQVSSSISTAISNLGALASEDQITTSSQIGTDVIEETNLSQVVRDKLNNSAPNNFNATVDPTATDDSSAGWEIGSVWINTTIPESYRCLDNTVGAAVWVNTTLTTDELATVATTGNYSDLNGLPTLGTAASEDTTAFATAAQGLLAASAIQPGDNVSELNNDAGYITNAEIPDVPVDSVFGRVGTVVAEYGDYTESLIEPAAVVTGSFNTPQHNAIHLCEGQAYTISFNQTTSLTTFPIGSKAHFIRADSNAVDFSVSGTATLISVGGTEILRVGGWATLVRLEQDRYALVGDV